MSDLRIGIIVGSTRDARFADRPVKWLMDLLAKRGGASFELVDLRDYPLPFFNEPKSPAREPSKLEVARAWTKKIGELDGYIFITAEHNHSITGVLKNAIDFVYAEFNRKPATFVGYGNAGGARAIEQLRLILVELQVAPLRSAVHIQRDDFIAMLMHGKTMADFPAYDQAAEVMIAELLWWANTLRAGRTA